MGNPVKRFFDDNEEEGPTTPPSLRGTTLENSFHPTESDEANQQRLVSRQNLVQRLFDYLETQDESSAETEIEPFAQDSDDENPQGLQPLELDFSDQGLFPLNAENSNNPLPPRNLSQRLSQ